MRGLSQRKGLTLTSTLIQIASRGSGFRPIAFSKHGLVDEVPSPERSWCESHEVRLVFGYSRAA